MCIIEENNTAYKICAQATGFREAMAIPAGQCLCFLKEPWQRRFRAAMALRGRLPDVLLVFSFLLPTLLNILIPAAPGSSVGSVATDPKRDPVPSAEAGPVAGE